MDYSSEEDSDISESEIEEYAEKPYEQLRAGKYKVKNLNGTLRCPYCAGKKNKNSNIRIYCNMHQELVRVLLLFSKSASTLSKAVWKL